MTATTDVRPARSGKPHLRRDIGMVGLLFTAVGSIIGSGWLFGAMNAAQLAGPAAIFSWLIAAVMIMLIGLTYAELGTMFPVSGGVVRMPHYAFGGLASYLMGWITWLSCAVVAPIEVEGAVQYATKYFPLTTAHPRGDETVHTLTPAGFAVSVVLLAVFCVVNVVGVRFFARLNNVLVWWKLAIIGIVVVALLVTAFHGGNFTSHGFAPSGMHGVFTAIATAGITFSYLGFRQGIELAGETTNPRRNVPIAVIGSVLLTAVIYIALQIAFIGAVPSGTLGSSGSWSALTFTNDFGPLAAIASILGLTWLAVMLYIDAIVSPGDTGLVYTAVTSRLGYAMARNGNAPDGVAKLSRTGVPWVSTAISFVVGLVIFLPFPSWQQLVGLVTGATVLSFGSGPLVFAALRRELPDRPRPFRLPGGDIIPFLGFYSSNMIVFWAGWDTNWKLFVAILVGLVLLAVFGATGALRERRMDWRAGVWAPLWLAGLALISYLSSYGGTGTIGLGWGFVVNLVWAAVIYVLALKVRLPSARVRQIIEETPHDEVREGDEAGTTPRPAPTA
ncbi:APC family permease [Rugosimonospora africana]|uniref:Amino acid permease n=1 Tax=Rugosimonospora africana TaxID=556532 RepID=A0A8J3QR10_9ACTN|nr:APC family permease [Rugosimonospora africana]GIH14182.1 amino acid permease [Rugosimonospora africana]